MLASWPQASQFISLCPETTLLLWGLLLGQLVEDSSYSPLPISYARNPRSMKVPSMLTNDYCIWPCGLDCRCLVTAPQLWHTAVAPTQVFHKACLVGQEDEELPKVASSGIRRPETAGDNPSADTSGLLPVGKDAHQKQKKSLFWVPAPSFAALGTETWDFPA